jgi:hypothetical protein
LANKLKECQVFGVSSDEYLNYAESNRAEWETRGEEMVCEMVAEVTCTDILPLEMIDDSDSSDIPF